MTVCPYIVSTGMFRGAFGMNGGEHETCNKRQHGKFLNSNGSTCCRSAVRRLREWLIPALTAESVAEDIVRETMNRRKLGKWYTRCMCGAHGSMLILPRWMALAPAVLRVLPIGVQEWILDLMGGVHGMTGFRGHTDHVSKKVT